MYVCGCCVCSGGGKRKGEDTDAPGEAPGATKRPFAGDRDVAAAAAAALGLPMVPFLFVP